MNENLRNKIERITKDLIDVNDSPNKHFSFLVQRNRIISVGMNSSVTTHPMTRTIGYRADLIHSELDSLLKIRWRDIDYSKITLINTRINIFSEFGMCKPCGPCQRLLKQMGIKKVYYIDGNAQWQIMRIV